MTKAEAVKNFARHLAEDDNQDIRDDQDALRYMRLLAKRDRTKIWEMWDFYTDGLHRDGQITNHQVNTWLSPV